MACGRTERKKKLYIVKGKRERKMKGSGRIQKLFSGLEQKCVPGHKWAKNFKVVGMT